MTCDEQANSVRRIKNLAAELAENLKASNELAKTVSEKIQNVEPKATQTFYLGDEEVEKLAFSDQEAPVNIKNFTIIRLLGQGGMGNVYLAEQEKPVRRQVALKIVRAQINSPEKRLRLEAERQAMARLNHPHIAGMLEAGTTSEGIPYFVMEYVPGSDLDDWVKHNNLPLPRRLEIFVGICRAVEFAHKKGILHRDLKPSNILVSKEEGTACPKIIDFGIAKALDNPLTDETLQTGNFFLGTPEYMSPETFPFSPYSADLDTRSDVYSLGVILYELLVGVLPFNTASLPISDRIRKLASTTPPKPSKRYQMLDEDAKVKIADYLQKKPEHVAGFLKKELDWIIGKAMAKDREERYGSAAELADDVERFLNDQPIKARTLGMGDRIQKFIRRNRGLSAAVALIALLIWAGIFGITTALFRARQAEAIAKKEAQTSQKVTDFLIDFFEISDPNTSQGGLLTVQEMLSLGSEKIHKELADEPVLKGRLLLNTGLMYLKTGQFQEGIDLIQETLDLREQQFGMKSPERAEALYLMGRALRKSGKLEEALENLNQALTIQTETLGEKDLRVAGTLYALSRVYLKLRRLPDAFKAGYQALAIRNALIGPESLESAEVLHTLATCYSFDGQAAKALSISEQALGIQEKILGADHYVVAETHLSQAKAYEELGDMDAAERYLLRSIQIQESSLGLEHPNLALSLSRLGSFYCRQNRDREAQEILERAFRIQSEKLLPDHFQIAESASYLGFVYWHLGMLDKAKKHLRYAQKIRDQVLEPNHPNNSDSLWGLGCIYRDEGLLSEAEPLLRRSLKIRESYLSQGHRDLVALQKDYVKLLHKMGNHEQASILENQMVATQGPVAR